MTWTIVLAGGEGTRLREESLRRFGVAKPKQYCDFDGKGTLLDRTLDRASQFSPRRRVVVLTARPHRAHAEEVLSRHSGVIHVEQPRSRDTAPAVIHALLRVLTPDIDDDVVVLPCDHHVTNEPVFEQATRDAMSTARHQPHRIAVLGAAPAGPVDGYGWIVPKSPYGHEVHSFVEKPGESEIPRLRATGALVNTMVFAARMRTLATVLTRFCPGWWKMLDGALDDDARLDDAFDVMPPASFSREVLEQVPYMLRLVPVPSHAGWSDIGTPDRLHLAMGTSRTPDAPPVQTMDQRGDEAGQDVDGPFPLAAR